MIRGGGEEIREINTEFHSYNLKERYHFRGMTDDIKMYLWDAECKDVKWSRLAVDSLQWLALENTDSTEGTKEIWPDEWI
jgi:hypothetical protein